MAYYPHSDSDRAAMLKTIGVKGIEDLFSDVPARVRFPKLNLPEPLSEMETMREMMDLAWANADAQQFPLFLGAGAYNHYSPSLIHQLLLRGEFLTAYTPYQPEISQGTLQAIFEYQSMICALTGMEAANASHYDGATSMAEASPCRSSGRLLPNRDVRGAPARERLAVPARPALGQPHSGELSHEVQLGRPDVAEGDGEVLRLPVDDLVVV